MARLISVLFIIAVIAGAMFLNVREQPNVQPAAYVAAQEYAAVEATQAAYRAASAAATNSAFHSANAVATLEAISGTATSIAAEATRQAESDASATAANREATVIAERATERSLAVQATGVALSIQGTRELYYSQATATVAAAAAAGTAGAIQLVAEVESKLADKEIERLRINNEEALSEIRTRELTAWALIIVLVAGILAGLMYLVLLAYGRNARRPPEPTTQDGSRPRLLPQRSPRLTAQRENIPAVVTLPEELPADKIALGLTPGRPLWYSQKALGDILGAGIKGSGKSSLVRSLAYQARMQGWTLFLADAEGLTFEPAVWGQVATNSTDVEAMLGEVFVEFDRRLDLYREAFARVRQELPAGEQFFVEDLQNYAKAARLFGLEPLRPMMLAWDEANNHIGSSRQLDEAIHELLRRNRKPGLTVAIFGHTWHARQVNSAIFTNLTRRICLRCDERTSRVVLGNASAAQLPLDRPGQAIMAEDGQLGRFQIYYLPAARILRDIKPDADRWQPGGVADAAELQAEIDANSIAHFPLASRRQVALQLVGFDNGAAYERADAALRVLAGRGIAWAAELLEAVPTTI